MNKPSRNDPCWCGSGKKYKKCHINSDNQEYSDDLSENIIIKTKEQIDGIKKSCRITKLCLDMVEEKIKAGITTNTINDWVHEYIIKNKAIPAPLNYKGFPKSVCTSINDVICHGIPSDTILKDGDIINVDVTTILDGFYGDASRMFLIGNVSNEAKKLVQVTKECLDIGINQVKPGNDIGEIGIAIEEHAKKFGYSVVKDYAGHGIGLRFHEDPEILHYRSKKNGIILKPGMTFTIEPMINVGNYKTKQLSDGWTAVTVDGSLSAQWEHTLLVTQDGVEILTN